jgi:hypothetical protein
MTNDRFWCQQRIFLVLPIPLALRTFQTVSGRSSVSRNADLLRTARRIDRVSRHPNLRVVGPSLHEFGAANFKKVWRTGEVSTLASHGITPVEHDDDSEHRPGINDLRYVIQNNSDALSAGVTKFFMSVAGQYRHQA